MSIAPTASAQSAAIASSATCSISGSALLGQEGGAGALQHDLGGAQAVLGGVAAPGDARRRGVEQEQADAVAVAPRAGDAGRDDQAPGAVAVQHHALGAVEDPVPALRARGGGDVVQVVPRLAFLMREGERRLAAGDLRQQRVLPCQVPQQAEAEHHGGEIGLHHQAAAEGSPSRSASRPGRRRSRPAPRAAAGRAGPSPPSRTSWRRHSRAARRGRPCASRSRHSGRRRSG